MDEYRVIIFLVSSVVSQLRMRTEQRLNVLLKQKEIRKYLNARTIPK